MGRDDAGGGRVFRVGNSGVVIASTQTTDIIFRGLLTLQELKNTEKNSESARAIGYCGVGLPSVLVRHGRLPFTVYREHEGRSRSRESHGLTRIHADERGSRESKCLTLTGSLPASKSHRVCLLSQGTSLGSVASSGISTGPHWSRE